MSISLVRSAIYNKGVILKYTNDDWQIDHCLIEAQVAACRFTDLGTQSTDVVPACRYWQTNAERF